MMRATPNPAMNIKPTEKPIHSPTSCQPSTNEHTSEMGRATT